MQRTLPDHRPTEVNDLVAKSNRQTMRYASDDPSSASADVTEIESQLRDAKGQPRSRHPDQPNPIPVRVRVVWDGGSEQWIDGIARRWTRDAVFVAFADERRSTAGVWVKPSDVERR